MRTSKILLVAMAAAVLSTIAMAPGLAVADDMFPPPWEEYPGSQYAEWDTWGGAPGPTPADWWETWDNDFTGLQSPVAFTPGANLLLSFASRTDVLEIFGPTDGVYFEIDNYDWHNPEKWVRVQITYHVSGAPPMGFDVIPFYGGEPGDDQFVPAFLVESTGVNSDGWITDAYDFIIEPNPEFEVIGLKFEPGAVAFVDQVVIDTICVPEPATMALLAIGVFALLKRRRNR